MVFHSASHWRSLCTARAVRRVSGVKSMPMEATHSPLPTLAEHKFDISTSDSSVVSTYKCIFICLTMRKWMINSYTPIQVHACPRIALGW